MSRSLSPYLRVLPALAAAVALTACTAKPENSPVIRKKFAEMDEMKEQLAESTATMRQLNSSIRIIEDELSNLRALSPGAEGASEVVSRLEALERQISTIGENTVAVASSGSSTRSSSTQTASANTSSGSTDRSAEEIRASRRFNGLATPARAEAETAEATEPVRSRTESQVAAASTSSGSTRSAAASTSNAAPARQASPASRGRYHTLQSGDTLEKLAASNNITVSELRSANRLPAGARPLTGQRIFIPGSGQ
jgi:LysM repeat protein